MLTEAKAFEAQLSRYFHDIFVTFFRVRVHQILDWQVLMKRSLPPYAQRRDWESNLERASTTSHRSLHDNVDDLALGVVLDSLDI